MMNKSDIKTIKSIIKDYDSMLTNYKNNKAQIAVLTKRRDYWMECLSNNNVE